MFNHVSQFLSATPYCRVMCSDCGCDYVSSRSHHSVCGPSDRRFRWPSPLGTTTVIFDNHVQPLLAFTATFCKFITRAAALGCKLTAG
ncbi:Uncharacterised protein [Vibrio cholerae]|nr:Uncharacterised protein [Vibrio cholerae]